MREAALVALVVILCALCFVMGRLTAPQPEIVHDWLRPGYWYPWPEPPAPTKPSREPHGFGGGHPRDPQKL